jgi:hypothetical protein
VTVKRLLTGKMEDWDITVSGEPSPTTAEILTRARDIYLDHGGARLTLVDPTDGRVCAMGALNEAASGDPLVAKTTPAALNALHILWKVVAEQYPALVDRGFPPNSHLLIMINDSEVTSPADVVAIFEKAIAASEPQGIRVNEVDA